MAAQTTQYYLAKNVFLSFVGTSAIFLDLKNDKYVSVEPERMPVLIALLSITPEELNASTLNMIERCSQESDHEGSSFKDIAEDFVTHNLLTTDPTDAPKSVLTTIDIPHLDLSGYEFGETPNLSIGHIFNFFWACASASLVLRLFTTERTVRSVKEKRNKQQKPSASDLDRIRDLVEIFNILRPIFFTTRNHCLFSSLALIKFMALHDIYPTWVFGVKVGPFIAHCWVQDDNFIYNEDLDVAHQFTPIMAV